MSVADADFVDVELAAAQRRAEFVELAAATTTDELICDGRVRDLLTDAEVLASSAMSRPVKGLGYYAIEDGIVAGEGHIFVDDSRALGPQLTPAYWVDMMRASGVRRPRTQTTRDLTGASICVISRDYKSWGHFWLDIAPRLLILKRWAAGLLDGAKLLVPHDLPDWALDALITLAAGAKIEPTRYDSHSEYVRCSRLIVPTLAHSNYAFHPASNTLFDAVVAECTTSHTFDEAQLLFVSRRGLETSHAPPRRRMLEAERVEAEARRLGFCVIRPESLTWKEQVALFAGARVVVGEHGSAMKSLLFSRKSTWGIVVNRLNTTQSEIAALRGHRFANVLTVAQTANVATTEYEVDLQRLVELMERVRADSRGVS